MQRVFTLMVLAFGLLVSGSAAADDLAERNAIIRATSAMMGGGEFAGLETFSTSYRQSRARTSSGLWKLTSFYSGVASHFHADPTDEAAWSQARRLVEEWTAAYPQSPTAHLAYAEMLVARAWSHRGGGYADSVKPEAWAPFHDYIEQARIYLEEHKKVASADPHWYEMMATIGKVQGWPEERFTKHIDEGLDREPLFYQTYFAAVDYYTPKWRGSPLAVERFAMRGLRRTRDTEGYGMYARIYWAASQGRFDKDFLSNSVVDWETMKLGIDDVLKSWPDMWNMNNFAYFACQFQDKEKAAELIGRITGEPIPSVWKGRASFDGCRAWTTPRAG